MRFPCQELPVNPMAHSRRRLIFKRHSPSLVFVGLSCHDSGNDGMLPEIRTRITKGLSFRGLPITVQKHIHLCQRRRLKGSGVFDTLDFLANVAHEQQRFILRQKFRTAGF